MQQKPTKLARLFSLAVADPEDNVTQQLSDRDNDNWNLICAAESA